MITSFNVLDCGFIPIVGNDGSKKLFGIRQTLSQAHELREISDPSPLVEYSLYRFLALFLMDALRPEEEEDLEDLFDSGKFDMNQIEQYISLCNSEGVSFDLFDDNRPFLQSKYDEKEDGSQKPVSVLDCTMPSGNNHTHFSHKTQEKLSPSKAVGLILTTYWFCTAAAQGYPSGVYGAPPFFGVIKGKNLFETLTSLLLPSDSIGLPFDDPPIIWRRSEPVQKKKEIGRTSWLHGLLFPTRRIHLVPDNTGAVVGVHLSQGENYVNKEAWRDPYVTYRSNDGVIFPMRPHKENPIWRNIGDIIDIPGAHASKMLTLYQTLHGKKDIDLTLYGVETSNASYLSVYRYDLKLPLKLSEQWSIELMKTCISVAQQLRRILNGKMGDISGISDAVTSAASMQFDKMCESRFWDLCAEMGSGTKDTQVLYNEYCSAISKDVIKVYDDMLKTIKLRGHALADAEQKRGELYGATSKIIRKEG